MIDDQICGRVTWTEPDQNFSHSYFGLLFFSMTKLPLWDRIWPHEGDFTAVQLCDMMVSSCSCTPFCKCHSYVLRKQPIVTEHRQPFLHLPFSPSIIQINDEDFQHAKSTMMLNNAAILC